MDAYVKSFATYRTIKRVTVLHRSLVLDSLEDESSTVVVAGNACGLEDTGNWLIIEGMVLQISQINPEATQTTLTLIPPINAFCRPLELSEQAPSETIGGFVASALQRNWAECADATYAVPYLTVVSTDTNAYAAPETDGSGCFTLPGYCRTMRRSYRTRVRFTDAGKELRCSIDTFAPDRRQVSFQDGRSRLKLADRSASGLAKLTVLCDIDSGEKDAEGNPILVRERADWYLSESGEISPTVPDRRAAGDWGIIQVKNWDEAAAKVTEEFAKNTFSHKVEFRSTLDLNVQDNCRFLVYGRELDSVISSKRREGTDGRYHYKAGLLATTATEKLRRLTL